MRAKFKAERGKTPPWVWHGCVTLPPEHRLGLVQLSRGGAEACVIREFDLGAKRFVEAGFVLPEAKTGIGWIDAGTVFVSTALFPDKTTASGSGRTVRRWRRGTPFAEAPIVFAGETGDMFVEARHEFEPGFERDVFDRYMNTLESESYFEDASGRRVKLDLPLSCSAELRREWLIVRLRSEWTTGARTYPDRALLVIGLAPFLSGNRDFEILFDPSERRSLHYWMEAGRQIVIVTLENVSCPATAGTGFAGAGTTRSGSLPDAPEAAQARHS